MKKLISLLLVLSFSGCVSFQTGLQLAQFGVNVGFDIQNYIEAKQEEAKEIVDDNGTK